MCTNRRTRHRASVPQGLSFQSSCPRCRRLCSNSTIFRPERTTLPADIIGFEIFSTSMFTLDAIPFMSNFTVFLPRLLVTCPVADRARTGLSVCVCTEEQSQEEQADTPDPLSRSKRTGFDTFVRLAISTLPSCVSSAKSHSRDSIPTGSSDGSFTSVDSRCATVLAGQSAFLCPCAPHLLHVPLKNLLFPAQSGFLCPHSPH